MDWVQSGYKAYAFPRLIPPFESLAGQRHILFELIVTKKSQSCNRVINTFHPICPLDTCDVRSRRGAMSAIIRSVSAPRSARVDVGGPGPPAARCASSSESSASTHPRPALRSAPGPKTGPPRRTAGCSPPGGPVGSESAWLHAQIPPMSAGPPYLPFSHVTV